MADPTYQMLAQTMQNFGLGALAPTGADGNPTGWLADQIRQGYDTIDEIMMSLQNTDVFRQAFGVISEQQQRAARGEPVYVMSPSEVLEYRRVARQQMASANLPEWFYDTPQDFDQLILNDISTQELGQRITQTFDYLDNAPSEVTDKFDEYYGVGQGRAALAAYVLDPSRTVAQLERARRTAFTAGMAKRYDLSLTQEVANRIAELPQSDSGIVGGLEQIAQQSSLFNEGIFEATDLTANREGIGSVFEGDADAMRRLQQRQIERTSAQRAPSGGAAATAAGVVGAGYASS